ncbi:hypothetical protein AB0L49_24595 [Streptomyces antimycoticus]|uniref:hypothetical protein n=1 Tax=Streptomyces antimycoticus TaxID=68175 RepID=UPI0034312CD2
MPRNRGRAVMPRSPQRRAPAARAGVRHRLCDSGPPRQRIGNARAALRHTSGIAVRSLAHLA